MNKIMVSGLILLSLSVNCACREKEPGPQVLILRGHFAAVGSAPFVKLAFRAENGLTYEVAPGEARASSPSRDGPSRSAAPSRLRSSPPWTAGTPAGSSPSSE